MTFLERRFVSWISGEDVNGCWIWMGGRVNDGYGQLSVGSRGNRIRILAHRLSYNLFIGDIPDGIFVLHECDNPPCVNPFHLFLGTQQDNVSDMLRKGRRVKTYARRKLTDKQVLEIRNGTLSLQALATKFGVVKSTISYARNCKTYADEISK